MMENEYLKSEAEATHPDFFIVSLLNWEQRLEPVLSRISRRKTPVCTMRVSYPDGKMEDFRCQR